MSRSYAACCPFVVRYSMDDLATSGFAEMLLELCGLLQRMWSGLVLMHQAAWPARCEA